MGTTVGRIVVSRCWLEGGEGQISFFCKGEVLSR